ncbi:MAG: hypothetical protein CM15mP51_09180 [Porticoccaceae bacterium]|nr:MAG: hypothetical protein CM15mP51_09180 [Porticoccaceae bacterium]
MQIKSGENIFAVGDVFETVEDGGALEGDVSSMILGKFAFCCGSK